MPLSPSKLLISILLLVNLGLGLQVSPGSSCSSVCIDNINEDPSNPDSSNTYGSDISCNDADYSDAVGTKFEKCINCLQNSTDENSGESDQHWFLYNIRFTVDWCLFGYPNNTQVNNNPCVVEDACGNLATALETEITNTTNATTYDYCTADGGAFLGSDLSACTQCLENLDNSAYLANFVMALEAGCEQRPAGDFVIGLQGSLFSKTVVNITEARVLETSTTSHKHHALSLGGRIGIVVGCLLFALFVIAFLFICFKKRQVRGNIHSNFDARYGAHDISGPNSGAFINAPPNIYPPPSGAAHPTSTQPYTAGDYYDQQKRTSPPYGPHTYGVQGQEQLHTYTPSDYAPDKLAALPVHAAYLAKTGSGEKYALDTYPSSTPTTIHSSQPGSPEYLAHNSPALNQLTGHRPMPLERISSGNMGSAGKMSRSPSLAKKSPMSSSPGYEQPVQREDVKIGFIPPRESLKESGWKRAESPASVEQWPGEY